MRNLIVLLLLPTFIQAQFELRYEQNQTLTYDEVIAAYQYLDEVFLEASLVEAGTTDSGRPLHVFVMGQGLFEDQTFQQMADGKTVTLINNGIHPGESCGIDASLAYAQRMLEKGIDKEVLVAIIPVYNIGGALNRGKYSRANQQGPEEHGFRGNARNLDLNRDFIKADALNTRSFYAIFHALRPHIFIDTHASNGADYQYTMSLISTQKDKLNPVLSGFLAEEMQPWLYRSMEKAGWEMTPYVNVFGNTPDNGFSAFLETPRYASGYTSLFNTLGFITETHMLKPYRDRVEATLTFLHELTDFTEKKADIIRENRKKAKEHDLKQTNFDIDWRLDSNQATTLDFKGYDYDYLESELGNYRRLKYYQDKPKTFEVEYYDSYKTIDSAKAPQYYVLPQAWREVVLLMQYNQVEMKTLERDTSMAVNSQYITDFEFSERPYEGHFPLRKVKVEEKKQSRQFLKGDYLIPLDQPGRRFIMAVLEPTAVDSYLRWNFFDAIFQQKEYFSPYVFEDTAEELLKDSPELRAKFKSWKEQNPEKLRNPYATLGFIYRHSPYYEKEHLRYPVARIE